MQAGLLPSQPVSAADEEHVDDDEDDVGENDFDESEVKEMLEENESSQGAIIETAKTDWYAAFVQMLRPLSANVSSFFCLLFIEECIKL